MNADDARSRAEHPYNLNVGTCGPATGPRACRRVATLGLRVGYPTGWTPDAGRGARPRATAERRRLRSAACASLGLPGRGVPVLDPDDPLAGQRVAASARVGARRPTRERSGRRATTDARFYLNQFGIPADLLRAARRATSTAVDEAVELQSIVAGARTLARFIPPTGCTGTTRDTTTARRRSRQPVLAPVKLRNAGEHVADRLVTAIALGEYVPGPAPAVRARARRDCSAVSRASVREALHRLAAAGYVEIRRGRHGGAFVQASWGPSPRTSVIRRTLAARLGGVRGAVRPAAADRAADRPRPPPSAARADGRGCDPRRDRGVPRRRRRSRGLARRRPGAVPRDRDRGPPATRYLVEPEPADPGAGQPRLPAPSRTAARSASAAKDQHGELAEAIVGGGPTTAAEIAQRPLLADRDRAARAARPGRRGRRMSPRLARSSLVRPAPGDPDAARDEHLRVPADPAGARATRCARCSASARRPRTSRPCARSSASTSRCCASTSTGSAARCTATSGRTTSATPGLDAARRALPVTLELTLLSMTARGRRRRAARRLGAAAQAGAATGATEGFVVAGISVPDFWLGIMLVLLFAGTWQLLPPSGYVPFPKRPGREPALHGAAGAHARGRRGRLHPAHHARRDGGDARRRPFVAFLRAKGIPRAARSSTATRCATPRPDRDGRSASSSACCSAARSSSRRCSRCPASGGWS